MKNTLIFSMMIYSFSTLASPVWLTMSSSVLSNIKLPTSAVVEHQGKDASLVQIDSLDVLKVSGTIHSKLNRCGGFMAHTTKDDGVGALGKLKLWEKQNSLPLDIYDMKGSSVIHSMTEQVSADRIETTIRSLSSLKTRHFQSKEGRVAIDMIKNNWQQIAGHRKDVAIETYQHRQSPQPSIILTIKGTSKSEEVVILGAHADSIVGGVNDHAPGADDNASGIAAVTEVIKIMVDNNIQPQRTVKFIAYAAEEAGLIGSNEIAKQFKKDKINVVGVLQLDMTLYRGTEDKNILLVSDYTNKKQNEFLGKLIDEYVRVPWGYTKCGYGCSDHASWTANDYPASFPFESNFEDHSPFIHTQHDTLESAGGTVEHVLPFTKLALSFVGEMSL